MFFIKVTLNVRAQNTKVKGWIQYWPFIFQVLVGPPMFHYRIFYLSHPPPVTLFCFDPVWLLRRCHLRPVFLLQIWERYCVSARRNSQLCMCWREHAAVYERLGLLSVSLHDRYTHKWMWGWWRCLYVPRTAWQQASLADVTHGWLWISLFYTFICIAVGEVCVGLM